MNKFEKFLLTAGLYDHIDINQGNLEDLKEITSGKVRINCYCKECGEKRTFLMQPIKYYDKNTKQNVYLSDEITRIQNICMIHNATQPGGEIKHTEWYWQGNQINSDEVRLLIFKFECTFNSEHHLDYITLTSENNMIKIGQFPSVADIEFPELKQYKRVISEQDMQELKRAIGLFAQGIGIGSYAYIRRILERLIDKAKNIAINDGEITLENYERNKVANRIKMLNGYLPKILIDNAVVYGIISKGIHELTEDECLTYFPVMKEFIIMILEQWEQERKRKEAEKNITSAISKIASKT